MQIFEIREEKIYDLVTGKAKELVEENGFFNVPDLQKLELSASEVWNQTEKYLQKRKGHIFIALEHHHQRHLFVILAAPGVQGDTNKSLSNFD